jgi:hypothetical protein
MNWQRGRQPDSYRSFEAMKTPRVNPEPTNALMLHAPVLPQLPERLRGLVNAAYAGHGGAENMKLNDWRDLELELKRRLEHEYNECQQ